MTNLTQSLKAAILGLSLAQVALPQTPGSATLSGHVLAEDGHAVRATVTLTFATARGYPAPPRRGLTDPTGAFSFSKLPAGKYSLCAQVAASETAPASSPYIDTCNWGSAQAGITVATGQQVAGVVFTAPKGAWLSVSVADPDHVLPQASTKAPAPLEPELQLMVKGPDGLYRHARFVSATSAARTYQIAIPLSTALTLKVTSNIANVFDESGNQVQETTDTPFQLASLTALAPSAFTLHAK